MTGEGLSPAQRRALIYLARQRDGQGRSPGHASTMTGLAALGLVQRIPPRPVEWRLTYAGQAKAREIGDGGGES